jgi:hypothetical protein
MMSVVVGVVKGKKKKFGFYAKWPGSDELKKVIKERAVYAEVAEWDVPRKPLTGVRRIPESENIWPKPPTLPQK